jgi:hypothetical protein
MIPTAVTLLLSVTKGHDEGVENLDVGELLDRAIDYGG